MAIMFHCDYCGKKIEAQDSASGKWGKCPSCHNRVYVPNLNIDDDLKLAPVDEEEEAKKKQLMAETYRLNQDILQERDTPNEGGIAGMSAPKISDKELTKNIIVYLRQMADGDLGQANETIRVITPYRQAKKILDKIALSEIPEPELADVAPQVLAGLIRTLRSKIS
jgi:hypothetical protein